ncbi:hypothetical protein [Bradyrhizobium sp. HKCCYLS20291]|uniref:hypothetical protein n=1 Tax=Bradyrhizobium sp. HKCCYLS20291 TaxID=3420766 RepID=UPI003EBC30E9
MAETEIKRVNFFDGQFLKQEELNDLTNYAVRMQRRLLFALFDKSGVIETGSADLAVEVPNPAQKAIRVRAGMAIGRRSDVAEAHEIILRQDVTSISLTVASASVPVPLQPGDTGIVTIHYDEQPSGGDAAHPTRIKETAVVTVHRNAPPEPNPARPLIVLGKVAFDSMVVTPGQRQRTQINAGLTGGKPLQQSAVISSIDPQQALQGSSVQITIAGMKLGGATAINFDKPGITVQNIQSDLAGARITAMLTVAANAALGTNHFTVTTSGGPVDSPANAFSVLAAPQVTAVTPATSGPGGEISVRGVNIRDPRLGDGQPATGTEILFLHADTSDVLAKSANVTVAPNIGTSQQVKVKLPPVAEWRVPLLLGVRVRVRLIFQRATAEAPGAPLQVFLQ